MVTVKLMGGLGNQMFQYACGRSISLDLGEKLILDTSYFQTRKQASRTGVTMWSYSLYHLNVHYDSIKNSIVRKYKMKAIEIFARRFPPFIQILFPKYVVEKDGQYIPDICKKGENLYLIGHWASEKYFKHNEDIIRHDFQVLTPQNEINRELSNKISHVNSVCLHVRRGDYVTSAVCNDLYYHCTPDYYHNAISYIAERVIDPVFFVFSDDIKWARENILTSYEVHYMDQNNSATAYEDLRLMMSCKHFIIPNSTFSWWGAWLGNFNGKIVIHPEFYFSNTEIKTEIYPDSWVRM